MKQNNLSKSRAIKPQVSVVMPVYNGASFLSSAINSILQQSLKNIELIVVDDNSADDSVKILKKIAKQDQRLKLILSKVNLGESGAANLAFSHTQAPFIARMDQDDIAHPDRLKKQLTFLRHHLDCIVVGCQTNIIDENDRIIGHKIFPTKHPQIFKDYIRYQPMLHPGVMIRRSLLPNPQKLWTNQLKSVDDYLTLFSLLFYGKFANLNEKLMFYRIHTTNNSYQQVREKFINSLIVRFRMIKKYAYPLSLIDLFFILCQTGYVLVLPEKFSMTLYLYLKGMLPLRLAFPKLFALKKAVSKTIQDLLKYSENILIIRQLKYRH